MEIKEKRERRERRDRKRRKNEGKKRQAASKTFTCAKE